MTTFRRCDRCGQSADTELSSIPVHGGVPYCNRCVAEVQLDHARERASAIPELERRLKDLGGPAPTVLCGYVTYRMWDDTAEFGDFCVLPKGHDGNHATEGAA